MITRITTENFELSEELDKYAHGKLGRLERYIPKRDRSTTLLEVTLSELQGAVLQRTCRLDLKLRRQELTVKETTQHMYASVDVAVADMEQQLRIYRQHNPSVVRKYTRQLRMRAPKVSRGKRTS